MGIMMKCLDHSTLLRLRRSSHDAGRKQIPPEELVPRDGKRDRYVVNFRFEHECDGEKDVRLSVVLKPGALTAWLDVSQEEYDAIPDVELSELEWEEAVCVGIPRWVE